MWRYDCLGRRQRPSETLSCRKTDSGGWNHLQRRLKWCRRHQSELPSLCWSPSPMLSQRMQSRFRSQLRRRSQHRPTFPCSSCRPARFQYPPTFYLERKLSQTLARRSPGQQSADCELLRRIRLKARSMQQAVRGASTSLSLFSVTRT